MLHALDRQKIILNNLKIDSVTSINHLIQKTKFHESTIRRDLKILAINQKIVILRKALAYKNLAKQNPLHVASILQLTESEVVLNYAFSLSSITGSIIRVIFFDETVFTAFFSACDIVALNTIRL